MTFIERVDSLSARVLRERTYDLIVAPAIADVQFENGGCGTAVAFRGRVSVLAAFLGALYEDLTSDSSVLTLAAIALIPACYYGGLLIICVPQLAQFFSSEPGKGILLGAIFLLSLGPFLACSWPQRAERRSNSETADA